MQAHMPLFVKYAGFLPHYHIENHHQDEAERESPSIS